MQVLHLLAAASDLSEFCRTATHNFQNDISLLHEQSQNSFASRWELTIALTDALTKGLQLYVGSSTNNGLSNNSTIEGAKQQRDGDGSSSCVSSGGRTTNFSFKLVQQSQQHLLVLAAALMYWWKEWSNDDADCTSLGTACLNAGEARREVLQDP
jgi:hypothetical protein